MTRLLVCKFETSNFGFFPFAEQKSTLPGKVDFFKVVTLLGKVGFFRSGHFTEQSDTFSQVGTLPGKFEFGSPFEQSLIGPEDFWNDFQFVFKSSVWPKIYPDLFLWLLGAWKGARLNYCIFKIIKNGTFEYAIFLCIAY